MIDVSGLKLSLDAGLPEHVGMACKEIARQLGIPAGAIRSAQLLKRSVDARKKSNVHFIATYRLELDAQEEARLLELSAANAQSLKGIRANKTKPYEPLKLPVFDPSASESSPACAPQGQRPVVVGAGPAGLFAAWYLAKCGLAPILVEQGAPVEQRTADVNHFFATGQLNPWSNIQFGEGGAGTFSDGKLTTNTKNPFCAHVLHWFVDAGAPESILWQAHPHLGSDNLARIVANIRQEIIRLGGLVRFHTQLAGLKFDGGALAFVQLRNVETEESEEVACTTLVLACGHSARPTFELVRDAGFAMEQKPFSMGVRIEHPQALINEAQWGSAANHPALGAAEYKLVEHLPSGRNVYSFCMCPGGEVVAAASEAGGIVTNGMSNYARNGKNANAALLVNVDPVDFGSSDVLAGMELQRAIEQRAFEVATAAGGQPYQAPSQRLGEFMAAGTAAGESAKVPTTAQQGAPVQPTYERGVVDAPIDQVLPPFITQSLREALPHFGKKIAGFDHPNAVITAPETRSSSPVRICRNDALQAYFANAPHGATNSFSQQAPTGIYPCGEGPGFAGGIMSAAVDGLKVAEKIAQQAAVEQALCQGKPALFPTDTVYGLGLAALKAAGPDALYNLKQRDAGKPIAWLVGSPKDLTRFGKNVPDYATELAKQHWPGALTLIVEASPEVPAAFRAPDGTIALRMPNHPQTLALIAKVGPLAATSANLSGNSAPTSLTHAPAPWLETVPALDGITHEGIASTVIDCTQVKPRLIRQGSVFL